MVTLEPLPAARDGGSVPVLVFTLDGKRFAVPTPWIRRIEYPVPLTRVPGGPPWLEGLANLMGEVVAVVDTRRWLGLPEVPTRRSSRWLVLGYEDELIALTIDQLPVLQAVAATAQWSPTTGERRRHGLAAELDHGGEAVALLDLAALLSDEP